MDKIEKLIADAEYVMSQRKGTAALALEQLPEIEARIEKTKSKRIEAKYVKIKEDMLWFVQEEERHRKILTEAIEGVRNGDEASEVILRNDVTAYKNRSEKDRYTTGFSGSRS